MMNITKNIFFKEKILVYGLGKSGISAFKFLKKRNDVFLYDDRRIKIKDFNLKKKLSLIKKSKNLVLTE